MRVRSKVFAALYNDTAMKEGLFTPSETGAERTLTEFQEMMAGKVIVPDADSPFTLPMGSVAAGKGVFVRCTTDFTIAFDGGAALTIKRPPAAGDAVFNDAVFYADVEFTSVEIATVGAVQVDGVFALWGDLAA